MSWNQSQRVYNHFRLPTPKFTLTPFGGLAIVRPNINMYNYYAQSYASYSFNIAGQRLNQPIHSVQWYNVKTNQPGLTINMLSDSGADYSTLDSVYAKQLGIDDYRKGGLEATVSGTGGTVDNKFYIHRIPFRIGSLKPVLGSVAIGPGAGTNVLGRTFGLNYFDVTYNSKTVKYNELAQAQSSLAQARWRNRI